MCIGQIGGEPNWYLGNEAPSTYAKEAAMVFLFELFSEIRFERLPHAPKQVKVDLRFDDVDAFRELENYELFLRNYLYFFGTEASYDPKVYILTQI